MRVEVFIHLLYLDTIDSIFVPSFALFKKCSIM